MSKVKEIYVECKKSRKFQTYTVGNLITVEDGDDVNELTTRYKAKCRKSVMDELELDEVMKNESN